jgi:hypothetical protein
MFRVTRSCVAVVAQHSCPGWRVLRPGSARRWQLGPSTGLASSALTSNAPRSRPRHIGQGAVAHPRRWRAFRQDQPPRREPVHAGVPRWSSRSQRRHGARFRKCYNASSTGGSCLRHGLTAKAMTSRVRRGSTVSSTAWRSNGPGGWGTADRAPNTSRGRAQPTRTRVGPCCPWSGPCGLPRTLYVAGDRDPGCSRAALALRDWTAAGSVTPDNPQVGPGRVLTPRGGG